MAGTCTFRVFNKVPEWWDAETGTTYAIKKYSVDKEGITIPLNLPAHGSGFIVFSKAIIKDGQLGKEAMHVKGLIYTSKGLAQIGSESTVSQKTVTLKVPWKVRYEHKGNTPLEDSLPELSSWHTSANNSVKYFSGQATYYNSFELRENDLKENTILLLHLNKVKEIAEVYLNGTRLGLHWHASQSFALNNELRVGKNFLGVEVVNSINNSLIGDAMKPENYRQARSNISRLPNAWQTPFRDAPLLEAGLLGPVTLQWAKFVN